MKIGVLQDPINWLIDDRYNLGVIIIIQLWLSLGAGFLSFIAGFQTVDRSIYEAGAIDGIRNRFQELWYLTLPSMRASADVRRCDADRRLLLGQRRADAADRVPQYQQLNYDHRHARSG